MANTNTTPDDQNDGLRRTGHGSASLIPYLNAGIPLEPWHLIETVDADPPPENIDSAATGGALPAAG